MSSLRLGAIGGGEEEGCCRRQGDAGAEVLGYGGVSQKGQGVQEEASTEEGQRQRRSSAGHHRRPVSRFASGLKTKERPGGRGDLGGRHVYSS